MRRPRLLLLSLLIAVPTLTLAGKLGHTGGSDPVGGYALQASNPEPGEHYTRTVAGDFDGDCQQDVAYLLGEKVEVMIDPGLYESRMTCAASGFDMVTVPGADRDDLLVVDALGLVRVTWNYPGAGPCGNWLRVRRLAVEEDLDWIGVDLLRTWSDGPGTPYVFGRYLDGTTIVWMRPGEADWVPEPVFATGSPEPFLDLAPLDFDADGEPELAVIFPSGMAVYELGNPTPVAYHTYPGVTSTALAPLRHTAVSVDPECVAWIGTAADGAQYFAIVDSTGIRNPVPLGHAEIFAMRAGDYDDDGDDDLLCASTASWDLTWVENTGLGEPVFSPPDSVSEAPEANLPADENTAWPVIADLDGDGDGDAAYPIQDDEPFLWVWREAATNQAALRPRLVTATVDGKVVGATVDANQTLRVDVEVDENMPGKYLKIVAWTRDDPSSPMNPQPLRVKYHDVSGRVGTEVRPFEVVIPGGPSQSGGSAAPETFEPLVYLLFQLYDGLGPTDPPTTVYPGLLLVLHAQGVLGPSGQPTANDAFVTSLESSLAFVVMAASAEGGGVEQLDGPGGDEVGKGGDVPCTPVPPNSPPGGR